MRFEHRGWIIELFLVGIHHPSYPYKIQEEARAIWKMVINGKENSGTRNGDREKVLADIKAFIDWLIDDLDMKNIFQCLQVVYICLHHIYYGVNPIQLKYITVYKNGMLPLMSTDSVKN